MGGLATRDGRRLRTGLLFRADALYNLTDADLEVLAGLGLACVIDLRGLAEVQRFGPDRLPVPGPRVVELPVVDAAQKLDLFAVIRAVVEGRSDPSELDFLREDAPGGGAPALMADLYRGFVAGAPSRAAFGAALRLAASPQTLPLLFHCTAGKDRTGWLAAVMLSALDVDRDAILADYLRTNDLSARAPGAVLSLLDGKIPDPSVVVPMLDARAAYLDAAFTEVDRAYGGMAGYLRDGLGADDALLASLRANLLE
jgi:protein-tyrosine phosphatase